MKQENVIEVFKRTGALLEGHFILSSGLHSSVYLQCAIALQSPAVASEFGAAIASEFREKGIETVASPAIGGLIIGYEVARHLGARFIWTEREQGTMTLRRGFTVEKGERVLVVEDVITTGGSTRETADVLRRVGAEIVGAAAIIDRSNGEADVGVLYLTLVNLDVPAVSAAQCEACARGEVAVKPGSRASTKTV